MDVSWNELIGGSLGALSSHLSHVGGIRVLRLCHCRLNNDDVTELGDALSAIPLLEILDLSWNGGIGGKGLQSLLGKLPATLREIHLVACQLTAADAAALGGALCAQPRLCVLDISSNPQLTQEVEGGCFRDMAAALSNATSLTTLRLHDCGLSSACVSLTSLRELDVSCNRGLSGGLDQLTSDLAHLTHLESLDLHMSCLTCADLESCSLFPRLPLNSCSLSQESFTALGTNSTSTAAHIDVSWCKVVGGRTSLLLDALQPSVLLELRLSSCGLSTEDLCHLASACRHGRLSSLRLCDVSYNASVGDDGWCALFEAGGLGSLEELDLSLRPSSSASCSSWLPALLRALPGLTALSRLSAQRWRISSQERQKLKQCLKKRKVLLEFDTEVKDGVSSHQTTNPEKTEE
uniref:Leucine rich repeat containing 31 n=1 Tax=Cynoglossus semilaevis TaxID=244447 RepID=A0A3P8WCW1_CYNSE